MFPAPVCCGVRFGASMFVFSAEGNKTQTYVELQSSGWDGCHYLQDRSCPQLYQSPSSVHLVSTMLCILTPQDVVFCFPEHILGKDSHHSLPSALGRVTFKVIQIHLNLTCFFLLMTPLDRDPWGIILFFFLSSRILPFIVLL